MGNLTQRQDAATDLSESFQYDALNRLVHSSLSGQGAQLYQLAGVASVDYQYDAIGNLTYKGDTGDYTYGGGNAGPHAVSAISAGSVVNGLNSAFSYDANGNMLSGNGKVIQWTPFNKPAQITDNGQTSTLLYGPERQLIKQTETQSGDVTWIINGLFEVNVKNNQNQYRHHLKIAGRDVAILKTRDGAGGQLTADGIDYLHRDHLNSIVAVTDELGRLVERKHYDAFGNERKAVGSLNANNHLGYTGHRSLNSVSLIHMGGRVYDPKIGRFLSADPNIQNPIASQSFNRYSYVGNNPLSYYDPSGYFLKGLFHAIKSLFRGIKKIVNKIAKRIRQHIRRVNRALKKIGKAIKKYWKVIVAVAIVVVAPYAAPALFSAMGATVGGALLTAGGGLTLTGAVAAGAIAGGLSGLVTTGSLKGAITGAITGAAFAGIGNYFQTVQSGGQVFGAQAAQHSVGALSMGQRVAKSFAHAVVGGVSSRMSGGSFKSGFLAAGFTQAFAGSISNINTGTTATSYYSMGSRLLRGGAAAIVGGIGSRLGGGRFEDGARIGLWSRVLNDGISGFTDAMWRKSGITQQKADRAVTKTGEIMMTTTKYGMVLASAAPAGRLAMGGARLMSAVVTNESVIAASSTLTYWANQVSTTAQNWTARAWSALRASAINVAGNPATPSAIEQGMDFVEGATVPGPPPGSLGGVAGGAMSQYFNDEQ